MCRSDPTRGRRRRRVTGGSRSRRASCPAARPDGPGSAERARLARRGDGHAGRVRWHRRAVAARPRGRGRPARVAHRPAGRRHRSLARLRLLAARGAELHEGGAAATVATTHAAAAAGSRREGGQTERQTDEARHDELLQRAIGPSDERDPTSGGVVATTKTLAHDSAPGGRPRKKVRRSRVPGGPWCRFCGRPVRAAQPVRTVIIVC
jgi:hypothetical protein